MSNFEQKLKLNRLILLIVRVKLCSQENSNPEEFIDLRELSDLFFCPNIPALLQIMSIRPEDKYKQRGDLMYTRVMIQEIQQTELFNRQLHNSLLQETQNSHSVKIAKDANVYAGGDQDDTVYFIESGQIKLLLLSPEGKECIIAIHTKGDVFGELCLSELGSHKLNAIAMEETQLIQIPFSQFLTRLSIDLLLESFIVYLAVQIANQKRIIASLITIDRDMAPLG